MTQEEKAADKHIRKVVDAAGHPGWDWTTQDISEAFIAGAKWQKEQMLEDAVEGFVAAHLTSEGTKITVNSGYLPKEMCIKPGEKVRIIVLPKEEPNNG